MRARCSSPTAARSRCGSCAPAASSGSSASSAVSEADRDGLGRAARRPRGLHRPGAGRRELPARRRRRPGGARDRLRRDPPRLRLPVREPAAGARARAEHGLVFVGPPAEVIELAGDKLRAREEARAAGLPVLPGREVVASAGEARTLAERDRLPAAAEGGRRRRRARDQARRATRAELDAAARSGAQRGARGVRRRARLRRALRRGRAPRRGAGRGRRARCRSSTSASATARCSAATRS